MRLEESWFLGLNCKWVMYELAKPLSLHHKNFDSNSTAVFWTGEPWLLAPDKTTTKSAGRSHGWSQTTKPHTGNPPDYYIYNYLKVCVRWCDKSDTMRPAGRDMLLVSGKHSVDTVIPHFTVIHLMIIHRTARSGPCKFNQTTVCHSGWLFNSRMKLTCFAPG